MWKNLMERFLLFWYKNLESLLSEMLNHTTAKKVMVVTYKFLKERVLRICNIIDPSRHYLDYHFIGPRGINAFKNCDAVLVIGLPYPNLNSSAQDADMSVLTQELYDRLLNVKGEGFFFGMHDAEKYGSKGGPLHDPCTIAWLLEPEMFTLKSCHVEIET